MRTLLVLIICFWLLVTASPSQAFLIASKWPQPEGLGADVTLTYSYSNLLDGTLNSVLTAAELRAVSEEALRLWASYAPLHFVEVPDGGPPPADISYDPTGKPMIRIGHHGVSGSSAHAYFPATTGLAGDVHFRSSLNPPFVWGLSSTFPEVDILETMLHEFGHSLGLGHETVLNAIMNPSTGRRFGGLGTAFLLPDDIAGIQAIYGAGMGSVTPVPEPHMSPMAIGIGACWFTGRCWRRRRSVSA